MEKIKSIISHGSGKSTDATEHQDSPATAGSSHTGTNTALTGEGSHLAGAHQSQKGTSSDGIHPIYDQFTGHAGPTTSEQPRRPGENPPHFSNTTDVKHNSPTSAGALHPSGQTVSTTTPSLHPDRAHGRPETISEGASTASIKSGVLGFPQGTSGEHAALGHDNQAEQSLDKTQVLGGGNLTQSNPVEQKESSHLGRDAALGAGTAGTGGIAAHELSRHEKDNVPQGIEKRDFTQPAPGSTSQVVNQPTERDTMQAVHGLADRRTDEISHQPSEKRVEKRDDSHLGRDAALGAGAVGAGGLAAHELNRRHDAHRDEAQPYERSLQDPNVTTTGTDRSFPLAGGVTGRQPVHDTPTSHGAFTNEREPGTKDKEVGVHDGHGREALAGAAAAATASSAHPREHGTVTESTPRETRAQESHHPDALAAATAAAARAPGAQSRGEHEHAGHGHTFGGDPCTTDTHSSTADQNQSGLLYTEGPHKTDIANRVDPRLHVPGEFPSPTPIDESKEPSYSSHPSLGATGASTSTPDQHELRHTGTLDQPQTRSDIEQPTSGHHYGRDAALAGGAGAAGLGAYEASKHHQREPTDVGAETFPTESSPYSSTKLDPRVDGRSAGYDAQRFNPTATTHPSPHDSTQHHHGRDAALASGATGGAALAGTETAKHHGLHEHPQPSTTQPSTVQGEATHATPQTQDEKSQHHYGRDAALAGAGAATAGGLYHATRPDEKSDSGPASSTIGPHNSNVSNVLDPRVQPDPALQKHHTAGATAEDPASKTVGPHQSNIANVIDPRVQPQPEKQKGHTTTGPHQSDTFNRLDPRADEKAESQQQHHYGRDAAIAGGTGAAGYGAYEAAKKYDDHRGTQPGASMNEQRYDPTALGAHDPTKATTHPGSGPTEKKEHHYGRDAAVAGGLGAAGAGAYTATRGHEGTQQPLHTQQQPQVPTSQSSQYPQAQGAHYPAQSQPHSQQPLPGQTTQDPTQQPQHHYGRDAAVAGGLGAAGAGTYAATHRHDQPTQHAAQQPYGTQQALDPSHQRFDSVQDPHAHDKDQHQKRDAATLAAGGAAAGAGGAYAYNQHEAEKERLAQEKAHAKELEHQRKEDQKAQEKKLKDQQKEFDHKQKETEKEQAKEKKHHDKLVAAEEKKHHKEVEKEEEKLEKERAKEEEAKEKKHHFFGFLHRDKKDKEKETTSAEGSPRASRDEPRHSKEYAAAGAGAGAAAGGAAAYEATHGSGSDSEDRKHRNKLHKDPPPGHPAREALEHQHGHEQHNIGSKQHVGIDGPIGVPDQVSGGQETRAGVYGAHPVDSQHHTVIEPHTGLPMNVEKYGSGQGGTDGSKAIAGHHHPTGQEGVQTGPAGGHGVTDWDAIKKANTPY